MLGFTIVNRGWSEKTSTGGVVFRRPDFVGGYINTCRSQGIPARNPHSDTLSEPKSATNPPHAPDVISPTREEGVLKFGLAKGQRSKQSNS